MSGEGGLEVPDPATTRRRRDVALAGHAGDEATARSGLEDPGAAVRATALGALLRQGRLGPEDVERGLADTDPIVRARAAEVAISLGPGVAGRLVDLLAERDGAVVEAACFALGELGPALAADGAAGAALSRVARDHPDALCREAAVAALGAVGTPSGLGAILDATKDKPAVRRRAVLALSSFEGPEVEAALERALEDRDWQVRQAAEDLTGRRQEGRPGRATS